MITVLGKRLAALALFPLLAFAADPPADPPRAARSVHLMYTAPEGDWYYNELTIERSTPNSYFMACGFSHGYYGLQELKGGKKVAIFSIWDPGKQNDPKSVDAKDRVEVLYHAEDVRVDRFGGEGTGGKSFLDLPWKLGETYRFAVHATVEGKKTSFAAWLYLNDSKTWKHLTTFRTITGGDNLKGYYSFIEDFRRDGKSATEIRRAAYTNGWVHSMKGDWLPLTEARFTADRTPTDNIDAGPTDTGFFLQTGGETKNHTPLKSKMAREAKERTVPEMPKE
jgi:hypothetical protein